MDNKIKHAMQQARAQYDCIADMILRLAVAEEQAHTGPDETGASMRDIHDDIHDSPLSLLVRDGWREPGAGASPEEYELLLYTGGPAVRICGQLDSYCQPISAQLDCQGWGTPWTDAREVLPDNWQEVLMSYVNHFFYGEG